jgi:hypothetical protein
MTEDMDSDCMPNTTTGGDAGADHSAGLTDAEFQEIHEPIERATAESRLAYSFSGGCGYAYHALP